MELHFQATPRYPQAANNICDPPRQFSCTQSLQLDAELRPEQFRKSKQGWCTKPFQPLYLQGRNQNAIADAAKALAARAGMHEQGRQHRPQSLQQACRRRVGNLMSWHITRQCETSHRNGVYCSSQAARRAGQRSDQGLMKNSLRRDRDLWQHFGGTPSEPRVTASTDHARLSARCSSGLFFLPLRL